MKIIRVLKRESPLLVAREIFWRAQREWNKRRLSARLKQLRHFHFRPVPYYQPDLRGLSGRGRALIVAFADEICAGRFPFLGYATAKLGTRPKWNIDFVCGAEWPQKRYEGRGYICQDGSDVKVPFELSRLQFLPVLGKAHLLTHEESYRQTAKDLLAHWIQSNPVLLGVNWTVAMEAALRAMSICFLLNLLSPLRPEEQPWLELVNRSLSEHLLYIEANLEFSYFITSNHYLSDVVGLYCLSVFLSGQGMAARRQEYQRRVEAEMVKQVYDDGADYEASIGYQVLVTQLFATALLLMRADQSVLPSAAFVERLSRMFHFLNTVTNARGVAPHVGDCDDGRTELLTDDLEQMLLFPVKQRNSLCISGLLGLGQRLFGDKHGEDERRYDDAAWYGLAKTAPAPYPKSGVHSAGTHSIELLSNAGIGVLHHRSAELFFFAIPNGIFGKGSHTHNDKLSFVLRVAGQEILCDSGTGCYTRDIATRNRFRSTAAHNTLKLDGAEQNRIFPGPSGLFVLGNEAAVTPIQEGKDARGCYFLRASHSGYRSLGVTHTRTIRAVEGEPAFAIEDELDGYGLHDFELNFQLAPNRAADVTTTEKGLVCSISGEPQIRFTATGPTSLQGETHPSLVSTTYGTTVPAVRVRFWGRASLPAHITTHVSWAAPAATKGSQTESPNGIEFPYRVSERVC